MIQKRYRKLVSGIFQLKSILVFSLILMAKPPETMAIDPPANIGGMINSYAKVTSLNSSNSQLIIDNIFGNSSDFSIGSKVLIIQMKGATVHTDNNSNFGGIINLNNAGNYEFATVANKSGNTIWLESLVRNYTVADQVQLVSVPQHINAEVVSNITPAPWDPALGIGGIVVLEVKHKLTLSANINADGAGFRGGAVNTTGNANDADNGTYRTNQASGYGRKGEGIAPYIAGQEFGRGPLANGGGGGNTHNAGGGGGGNFTPGGGGGTGWPQNNVEGGSGIGGNGFVYDHSINKIFLGGGGGSGQQNDGLSSPGAHGGGIVIIRAGKLNATRVASITANGNHANPTSGNDGAGGAGGGGSVLLDILDYAHDVEVHVAAKGGDGGNVNSGDKHGGGGGGGAGAILFSAAPIDMVVIDNQAGNAGNDMTNGSTTAESGSPPCLMADCDPIIGWSPAGNLMPLPIVLLYFEGKATQNSNILEWATATEKNNSYFTVERSIDGKIFFPLADVEGSGTNNRRTTYTFEDKNVNGISYYYRLTQTDFNGAQTTHSIIYILARAKKTPQTVKIGPNPFTERLFIDLKTPIMQDARIFIFDQYGKLVSEGLLKALQEQTTYEYHMERDLPVGVYYLKLNTNNGLHDAIKIIKQ